MYRFSRIVTDDGMAFSRYSGWAERAADGRSLTGEMRMAKGPVTQPLVAEWVTVHDMEGVAFAVQRMGNVGGGVGEAAVSRVRHVFQRDVPGKAIAEGGGVAVPSGGLDISFLPSGHGVPLVL